MTGRRVHQLRKGRPDVRYQLSARHRNGVSLSSVMRWPLSRSRVISISLRPRRARLPGVDSAGRERRRSCVPTLLRERSRRPASPLRLLRCGAKALRHSSGAGKRSPLRGTPLALGACFIPLVLYGSLPSRCRFRPLFAAVKARGSPVWHQVPPGAMEWPVGINSTRLKSPCTSGIPSQ